MKSFKGYIKESILLTEASTKEATRSEQAICYAYNRWKWSGDKEIERSNHTTALTNSGISKGDFKNLSDNAKITGKLVAKANGGKWGKFLNHSGKAAKGITNYYGEGGKKPDKTPKTDMAGNASNNISLKKAGGSQLVSGKAAETAGVLKAAIKHHDKNAGENAKLSTGIQDVIEDLKKNLDSTTRSDLQPEVAKAKKDFQQWYKEKNTDRVTKIYDGVKVIKGKKKEEVNITGKTKDRAIERHLNYELEYWGAAPKINNSKDEIEKILKDKYNLGKESIIKKEDFDKMVTGYTTDEAWKLGGEKGKESLLVKDKYRIDASGKKIKLNDAAIKKQVGDIIVTAMKSKGWISDLEGVFNDSPSLKKWVAYEAGSGLYKFTGTESTGSSYEELNSPVANKIVVFTDSGEIKSDKSVLKWAKDEGQHLVDNVALGYKGTGMSKYIVMRIFAEHYDSELSTLKEEISNIQSEYLLNEGFFSNIKDKLKGLKDRIVKAIKAFYERFIAKFVNALVELVKEGADKFLEAVGIEMKVKIKKPRW